MEKPGDKIKVITESEEFEGILMPQEREFLVIKLSNGYNIGIDRNKIKDIKLVSKREAKEQKAEEIKEKKGLPTISILHTGGTIASKVDYNTGGVVAKYTPEELILKFPELNEIANIRSRLVANMMSENMRFAHYNVMAREIEKEINNGTKGIIITHGTDTLHYTAAALSFMLENLPVPVILVGAQRSSDRGSTDAAVNIISAAVLISNTDFAGVGICMHESMDDKSCIIISGTKARKMHSSRRDAFRPVNSKAIARINFEKKKVEVISDYRSMKNAVSEKLIVKPFKDSVKIGFIKSHPSFYSQELLAYKGFDGLVIEGTGLGHMPINASDEFTSENQEIKNALKELIDSGTTIAMSTQTLYGRVQMNVYSVGRELLDIGVIGNYSDMTPETTFIKLSWVLSNYKKDDVPEIMSKNICGELTERTGEGTFLV